MAIMCLISYKTGAVFGEYEFHFDNHVIYKASKISCEISEFFLPLKY